MGKFSCWLIVALSRKSYLVIWKKKSLYLKNISHVAVFRFIFCYKTFPQSLSEAQNEKQINKVRSYDWRRSEGITTSEVRGPKLNRLGHTQDHCLHNSRGDHSLPSPSLSIVPCRVRCLMYNLYHHISWPCHPIYHLPTHMYHAHIQWSTTESPQIIVWKKHW